MTKTTLMDRQNAGWIVQLNWDAESNILSVALQQGENSEVIEEPIAPWDGMEAFNNPSGFVFKNRSRPEDN